MALTLEEFIADDMEALPVDVLDRQEIVTQIRDLLVALSDTKSPCTFALNGKWGTGKTFVLDMLERELQRYQDGEQFIVFHYNCWEYDYYEEPLIAIVSAMLDYIDDYSHILPANMREAIQTGLSAVKTALQDVLKEAAVSFAKNKLGIDLEKLFELLSDAHQAVGEAQAAARDFDSYYEFHQVVLRSRKKLSELSESKTLVIVVDELDRCLPQYAIKVLERLHHLFSGLENIVVILGIDRTQLDNTISQIFGAKTDAQSYLKKFINFEIELDHGSVNAEFMEKHDNFFQLFDLSLLSSPFPVSDYCSALFSDLDARTQEALMHRVKMLHNLLFRDEKKDISFLCFELLLLVLSHYHIDHKPFSVNASGSLSVNPELPVKLRDFFTETWSGYQTTNILPDRTIYFPSPTPVLGLMTWYVQEVYGYGGQSARVVAYDFPNHVIEDGYPDGLRKLKQLLSVIK